MINKKIKLSINIIIITLVVIFLCWILTKIIHHYKIYNDLGILVYSICFYLVILSLFILIVMLFRLLFLFIKRKQCR
ncbi:hypothetical protein SAMN05444377_10719 [Flavobacterium fontis]|uniref:Uncharacterized protein n=1 Tax=Flavobacterium fontis TaxID=1124188 RepID=A0A1M5AX82_9FLAO|nr:hypothetical protein SAMN05444377_10719 [Flavobacterium fontis]